MPAMPPGMPGTTGTRGQQRVREVFGNDCPVCLHSLNWHSGFERCKICDQDCGYAYWPAASVRRFQEFHSPKPEPKEKWTFLGAGVAQGYNPNVDGRKCYWFKGPDRVGIITVERFWACSK